MDEFQRTATRAEVEKRRKQKAAANRKRKAAREAAKKAATGAGQRALTRAAATGVGRLTSGAAGAALLGYDAKKARDKTKAFQKQYDKTSKKIAADSAQVKTPPKRTGREVLQPSKAALKKHTVKSGDTVSDIAKANNTTVAMLKRLNPKIKNMDKIRVGQILIVDEGTARTPYKGLTSKEITTGNVQRRPRKRPAKKGGRAGGKGRGMGVALRGGGAVSKR
tara:strand:- start:36 stop:701 length:666 start_codon:yes stop_codon:yes gene_type:complete